MSTDPPHPDDDSSASMEDASAGSASGILRSLFRQRGSFAKVEDAALVKLSKKMRRIHFENGETIFEEGDIGGWAFVVFAGEVEVAKRAKDGAMIQVNVLRPGNWGGMMSVFGNTLRSARLIAHGKVELRALYYDDLEELLEDSPGIAIGLLACMGRRLQEDAVHIASTLQYVGDFGLGIDYELFSPEERLTLDTIRHRAAAAESLGEIMDFLFESVQHVGNCDRLTLAFLDEDMSRAVSYWTRAAYDPLSLRADYAEDLAGSSLENVFASGRPGVINDMQDYARTHPERLVPRLLVQEGIRSSITLPLVVGNRTVGFLAIRSQTNDGYSDHDSLLYQAIVNCIGQAVEKAYRIELLMQANHDYDEVLGFVSHELQSPIAAMVTDTRLLVDGYLGELNDKQIAKLRRAIEKGEYLLSLVRDYLDLARLEDPSLRAKIVPDVDLCRQVVEPAIAMVDTERMAKNIMLDRDYADPATTANCDPALMQIAFGNLLKNAVKYGLEKGTIRVSAKTKGKYARLVVWNEGPGFDNAEQTKLFRKFSRLDDPNLRKAKGTGIGLYSTWRILQLHRGRVTARSEKGVWAEFSLSFPIRPRTDRMDKSEEHVGPNNP